MSVFEEMKWRGMIKDVSNEEEVKKALDEDKVKFYCGYDPTGESLTVGHLVQIVRMMFLQKYGHTPVVLVGGATGLIGDPRETTERKLLTLEKSLYNAEKIKKQLSYFLGDKAEFVNNHDWISKIDTISFLRDFGKHFNLNYMLAKDTIAKRLDTGISFTEFSYMIIQSIDFLHLYKHNNVRLQFGGSDQWGNITSGLELIRKVIGENNAMGMSSPLLLKSDGNKFGKSESGALWLDKDLTSPYEIYQYFLNTADKDIVNYLKTLTLLSKQEILELEASMQTEPEKRLAQKTLAKEVVTLMHGKKAYEQALKVTEALFTGDFNNLEETDFVLVSNSLDHIYLEESLNIVEVLKNLKLASSNREAREFINSNAVSLFDDKVTDPEFIVTKDMAKFNQFIVVKRGKKKSAIIIFK
ncbi:Tyrosyl-tRNA synthetase [Alteracholeplasma palmae J233]|uniref:Tyrosine--tRNA ligase n=1 Tax=Alteracholeplasma palmae (strain ATCC 49389 / J233) TaxID=1318466 RepID=U4KK09_ALTPJ|nr:tyrosine--tRNA ligase [Alteracholeplasma palmae]CCV63833.1 Tyrosyl-tRNA synthetase [Alteracholeplasma palmae J233]